MLIIGCGESKLDTEIPVQVRTQLRVLPRKYNLTVLRDGNKFHLIENKDEAA